MSDQIHYVWLDEDGEQMSPTHRNFGTALNFVSGWHRRVDRRRRRDPELDLTRPDPASGYAALSKTGKPPQRLVRIVVREAQEDLSPHELAVVQAMLEMSNG